MQSGSSKLNFLELFLWLTKCILILTIKKYVVWLYMLIFIVKVQICQKERTTNLGVMGLFEKPMIMTKTCKCTWTLFISCQTRNKKLSFVGFFFCVLLNYVYFFQPFFTLTYDWERRWISMVFKSLLDKIHSVVYCSSRYVTRGKRLDTCNTKNLLI